MKVVHSFNKLKIGKDVKEDVSFILTNRIGGYCYFASNPASRYGGVFFNDNFRMYKVIENIRLLNAPPITELKNNFFSFERKRGRISENFFMPYCFNSLVYELNEEMEVEVVLDIRESYKIPEFGRDYEIFEENGRIIVKYKQGDEFECYLVVSPSKDYVILNKWFKQEYDLDKKRNSLPFEGYVFSALKMKSKRIVFSFSFNKGKAIRENDYVVKNIERLKSKQKRYIDEIFYSGMRIRDKKTKMAYLCAVNSLNGLVVSINNVNGIYAGLPWFFQFWIRDEATSLKALRYIRKKGINKIINNILGRLVGTINDYVKIPNNYPDKNINSSDAVGWIFKRCYEINKGLLKEKIKKIKEIDQNNGFNGFIINGKKETWMDSIDREGARIEIQALFLNILECLFNLTNDGRYKELEENLKEKTRKEFWNLGVLKDGSDDPTIRPNVFIAAYIYPELLTKEEWITCFKNTLSKIWLDWGGISTLDKGNPLFYDTHTGEDSRSYHNGDSWFYLNNLSALVLYRTNKKMFKEYIKKILNSSINEILWKGAITHHAELSSASIFNSEGCLAQAWSSAMFIELVEELNKGVKERLKF